MPSTTLTKGHLYDFMRSDDISTVQVCRDWSIRRPSQPRWRPSVEVTTNAVSAACTWRAMICASRRTSCADRSLLA